RPRCGRRPPPAPPPPPATGRWPVRCRGSRRSPGPSDPSARSPPRHRRRSLTLRSVADRSVIPPGLAGVLNDGPPVTPVAAGSVLLLDVAASPWRVLMMRRPGGARFAPDVYVFPGGTVHASEDGDVHAADPVRAAAVRELFEEVGILLARDA